VKRLIIYTIVLNSLMLPAAACGPYYPYGDDTRFSIINPGVFGYKDFCGFHYSAGIFYGEDCAGTNDESGRNLNVLLWKIYCKDKVDTASIYQAVYAMRANELTTNSGNAMVDYLLHTNDNSAIDYLKFAKRCNDFNSWLEDPWERNDEAQIATRVPLINWALASIRAVKNTDIQRRYAFLAIRLSFYNGDEKTISNIYDQFFAVTKKKKDIIDYWALYFKAVTDTNKVRQNYNLALVFSNAPDKRLAISQHYNRDVPLAAILAMAKNSKERTAICLINDLKNVGMGLTELQTIYQLQPGSKAFSFLLLREINKLEDWIYTPYYTYFEPSVRNNDEHYNYSSDIKDYSKFALAHIEKDRAYAGKLLQFILTVNLAKAENPGLIKTAKAYLQLMTNQYAACMVTVKGISSKLLPAKLIKALCAIAMQPVNNCKIPAEFEQLIMQQQELKNNKFLFAIARELEYKSNTTQAALLYSKLNQSEYGENYVYWRTKKNHFTLGLDFYQDYFFYLDAEYNPHQMEALITSIEKHKHTISGNFEKWAYSDIGDNVDRLYDLLGTKYIRLNKLTDAYKAFKLVNDSTWHSESFYYRDFLDANPFYTNFYSEHRRTKADTITFTKTGITARLINYLQKADDISNSKRDYYYFLVANCYFNMTQYGNSWMMRRYFWSSGPEKSHLPDDEEYLQANLARKYYLKAGEVARTPQFAALCLRMAGRCEMYRLWDIDPGVTSDENKYYKEIKTKYPGDYEALMSNCYSFDSYFAARQNMTR
jgi:hypothetical protein